MTHPYPVWPIYVKHVNNSSQLNWVTNQVGPHHSLLFFLFFFIALPLPLLVSFFALDPHVLVAMLVTPTVLQGILSIWVLVGHKNPKPLCTLFTDAGLQQVADVYRKKETKINHIRENTRQTCATWTTLFVIVQEDNIFILFEKVFPCLLF